jgi:hypothetical protein
VNAADPACGEGPDSGLVGKIHGPSNGCAAVGFPDDGGCDITAADLDRLGSGEILNLRI